MRNDCWSFSSDMPGSKVALINNSLMFILSSSANHREIADLELETEASGSILDKNALRRSVIVSWLLPEGRISVANGKKVPAGFL